MCVCGGGGGRDVGVGGRGDAVYSVYNGLRYSIIITLAKNDFLSTDNQNMQIIVFYAPVKFYQNIPYSSRAIGQNSCS